MNENWGFLSTWYPNRTFHWHIMNDIEYNAARDFLDHPSVRMWFHLQHTNMTHPKLMPVPIGAIGFERAFRQMHSVVTNRTKKIAWLRQYGTDNMERKRA